MVILDSALAKRHEEGNPIRVGLVGAGFMGRSVALQLINHMTGMRLVAIANRTLSKAQKALIDAGVSAIDAVEKVEQLEASFAKGHTQLLKILCASVKPNVLMSSLKQRVLSSLRLTWP